MAASQAVRRRDLLVYDSFYMADHFLSRRLVNGVLGGVRERWRQRFLDRVRQHDGTTREVPRVEGLTPRVFVREHLNRGRPVVLAGAARDWPCVSEWDLPFFQRRFPDERVVVLPKARTTSGFAGTREDEQVRAGTYDQFIGEMVAGDGPYIRFGTVVEDHPDLAAQIDDRWLKRYFGPLCFGRRLHLFIGGAGSRTRLHCDMPPNLFVQVHGRKHWALYEPRNRAIIDPLLERSSLSFTTNLDVRTSPPSDEIATHMTRWEATLEPGDVLFNPAYMWHDVENLSQSIGLSARFLSPGIMLRASWVQQLLNLFGTNPPVWRAGLKKRDFNADLLASKNNAKAANSDYVG